MTYEVEKVFEGQKKIRQHNLTKSESEALKWLSDRDDIIIKSADKGGAVVVWGKEQYISEALRQLENNQYYCSPSKPTEQNEKRTGRTTEHCNEPELDIQEGT